MRCAEKDDRPLEEIEAQEARPSVVLPEPDSPTTPRVSPSRTATDDAVDRLDVADRAAQEAALDREPDLEAAASTMIGALAGERAGAALRLGGEQLLAYRRAAGRAKISAVGPARRSCPSVMTQTRSAILRTMPRSWVMNSIAMPRRP